MNDSGEFWRVLGCTRIRCHWKRDIVDTFTHHFCANGHGWTIGTSFPYIRTSKRQYSAPVQYTCISSCLSWLYFALQALSLLKPYTRWEITCIAALYAAQQLEPMQVNMITMVTIRGTLVRFDSLTVRPDIWAWGVSRVWGSWSWSHVSQSSLLISRSAFGLHPKTDHGLQNRSLSRGRWDQLAKFEAWAVGRIRPPPRLSPGPSFDGWLRLASGSWAGPGNH